MPAATDFAANASAIGDSCTPFGPSVAILQDGRALVVWVVTGGEPDTEYAGFGEAEIRGRWFNADGSLAGEDFVVNSTSDSFQYRPVATAAADGRVFVAWESGDGTGLRGIVLDPDATVPATDFLVNSVREPVDLPIGPGNQGQVAVTGLSDGRLAAVWTSYDAGDGGDGDLGCLRGRMLDADGTPIGSDMVLNSTPFNLKRNPSLAAGPDRRLQVRCGSQQGCCKAMSMVTGRLTLWCGSSACTHWHRMT